LFCNISCIIIGSILGWRSTRQLRAIIIYRNTIICITVIIIIIIGVQTINSITISLFFVRGGRDRNAGVIRLIDCRHEPVEPFFKTPAFQSWTLEYRPLSVSNVRQT